MKELEHLTLVPEVPVTIQPTPVSNFDGERNMAYDNLSQSLAFIGGSLKRILSHPNNENSADRFGQLVENYEFDYINYINISRNCLTNTKGPYFFVNHLPELMTHMSNDRIATYNGILQRFSEERLIEYSSEEISHDMQIPRLIEVNEDKSFIINAMQSAKEVIGQQLNSETNWIMDKRAKLNPRPSRLQKTAARITSLFM